MKHIDPSLIVQGLGAIFAMLAAFAWLKSAVRSTRPNRRTRWMDDLLNRISTDPAVWNAAAAALSAAAAAAQAVLYLMAAAATFHSMSG